MNRKLALIFTFLVSSIVLCETKYFYNNHDIKHAIEYLQKYTSMPMNEVLFVSSPRFTIDQDTFVGEINLSLSNQLNDRYVVSMTITEHKKEIVMKAIQSALASIVIFPDFEDSQDVQQTFFELPDQVARDKLFLVPLTSEYRSLSDLHFQLLKIISSYPNY